MRHPIPLSAAAALAVPGVDTRLNVVAAGQQVAVARCHVVNDAGEARPELVGREARVRQHFVIDEAE